VFVAFLEEVMAMYEAWRDAADHLLRSLFRCLSNVWLCVGGLTV
jgi:hypothetical protein